MRNEESAGWQPDLELTPFRHPEPVVELIEQVESRAHVEADRPKAAAE